MHLLSNPLRWRVVLLVLKERSLSGIEIAEQLGVNYDTLVKHLHLLRDHGILDAAYGEDRRFLLLSIPPQYLHIPGWLDFGSVRIRLEPDAQPRPLPSEPGPEIEGAGI